MHSPRCCRTPPKRVRDKETETVPIYELHVGGYCPRPARHRASRRRKQVCEGLPTVDESDDYRRIPDRSEGGQRYRGLSQGRSLVAEALESVSQRIGEQTALSGIMRLVAAAQASGSRTQALADRSPQQSSLSLQSRLGRDHSHLLGGLRETKSTL